MRDAMTIYYLEMFDRRDLREKSCPDPDLRDQRVCDQTGPIQSIPL